MYNMLHRQNLSLSLWVASPPKKKKQPWVRHYVGPNQDKKKSNNYNHSLAHPWKLMLQSQRETMSDSSRNYIKSVVLNHPQLVLLCIHMGYSMLQ